MSDVTLVHLSDLHFGGLVDLAQIEALEAYVPTLGADAVVISGDLTQRARHGELQRARAFVRHFDTRMPVFVMPGNHDVQWWRSPFGLLGRRRLYEKYRRYFGENLTPVLHVPGAMIVGALTSYGLSLGSMTPNLNDTTVKGHLPNGEVKRMRTIFEGAPMDAAKVVVVHHNVLRGQISERMGLSRWPTAQRRLLSLGVDVVLCGHDHQEDAGQIGDSLAVSTSGTHCVRTRGGRPSIFNLVRIDSRAIQVQHHRWDAGAREFRASDTYAFARRRPSDVAAEAAAG